MANQQQPPGTASPATAPVVESISAITLATGDMARAVRFYRALGFVLLHGGEDAAFTTFQAGAGYLNLIAQPVQRRSSWWGRVVFHVSDVDAFHARAAAAGLGPKDVPRDASWGERYFHLTDPDGHELSFARPLLRPSRPESSAYTCSSAGGETGPAGADQEGS